MKINGLTSTAVVYIGGRLEKPTYDDVCADKTGHAEVMQVEYNQSVVGTKSF